MIHQKLRRSVVEGMQNAETSASAEKTDDQDGPAVELVKRPAVTSMVMKKVANYSAWKGMYFKKTLIASALWLQKISRGLFLASRLISL